MDSGRIYQPRCAHQIVTWSNSETQPSKEQNDVPTVVLDTAKLTKQDSLVKQVRGPMSSLCHGKEANVLHQNLLYGERIDCQTWSDLDFS